MSGPFESAWLKWGRAVRHAHDLYAELNALALEGEHLCETRTEYDAKRHCLSLRVTAVADLPPILSLLLGDVVQNYRSCLDHVAWALVGQGRTPPGVLSRRKQKGVYFPISAKREDFNAALKGKLPGVRRTDIAVVRRYQPYKAGKRRLHLHVLTVLVALAREDKHRAIRPVLVVPQGGRVYVGEPRDCAVTRVPEGVRAYPLEIGAEVHRVYVRKTGPNPDMQMEPHLSAEPTVTPEIPLREWLTETRSFCYQLLSEFAEPPTLRLLDIGIKLGKRDGQPSVVFLH